MCSSRSLIILLAVALAADGKKLDFKFIYTNATTTFNPKYVSLYDYAIKPRAPGTSLDLVYEVVANYSKHPTTAFNFYMLADKRYRTLLEVEFDYCVMSGSKLKQKKMDMSVESLLNLWISSARRNSEMPKCPVKPGRYETKDLHPEKKNIPSFVPFGSYRIEINNFFKDPFEDIKNLSIIFEIQRN